SKDLCPVFGALIRDGRPAAGDAGICEDDVEAAVFGGDVRDEALHRILAARVAGDLRAFGDVGADHASAFASKQLDGGLADARGGACDERDLAFQPAHPPLIASARTNW